MLGFFRSKSKKTQTIWWALAIVTIVTFVGGFVFILGSGFSSGFQGSRVGAAGTVNGKPISMAQYQNALATQHDLYRKQYGVEPAERDLKLVKLQAWRGLVNQAILKQRAKQLGLEAYDPEVVFSMQTSPPQMITSSETFQTNGQFDPAKYQQALMNPNVNWAPFEEMVRENLPSEKLQLRLLASVKVSEPEMQIAFDDQYTKVDANILQILPTFDKNVDITDADIEKAYEDNKGRFCMPKQVQAEVLLVPRHYSDSELQSTRDLANSLVQRVRQGEDFAVLARDYSEAPGAENGGVVERTFTPRDFGSDLEPVIAALQPGQVTDAFQDGGRFMIFKLLERLPGSPTPASAQVRVAQIVLKVRQDQTTQSEQEAELEKLRGRAKSIGLSRAATEISSVTATTQFFGYNNPPQQLFTVPEASDWAMTAKEGEVGPLFQGVDEYCLIQLKKIHEPGPMAKEDLTDQLRQIAELQARVEGTKPKADEVAAALARGQSLTQASRTVGITPLELRAMTRRQPNGVIASIPSVMAAVFTGPTDRVIGPLRGLNGWYFVDVLKRTPANPDSFAAHRADISNQILQQRQQAFLGGLAVRLRENADIEDLRKGN
jgi:peptidyl-prolyl cis-trans isomerase D